MKECLVLFPNQLFQIDSKYKVILLEHPKFFSNQFIPLKLTYHRVTMQCYYDSLQNTKRYICFDKYEISSLPAKITIFNPIDKNILQEFQDFYGDNLTVLESRLFLLSTDDLSKFRKSYPQSFHHSQFYRWFRKEKNILMENNKPLGGKWSFDRDNRHPFDEMLPETEAVAFNATRLKKYKDDAIRYINKKFQNSNLSAADIYLPINREQTLAHFQAFITNKLKYFGKYEDASHTDVIFGFHSVLSPMINIGLITIKEILAQVTIHFTKYPESVEGFVRQLFWREYMRFQYEINNLENSNFFNHKRKLDQSWYEATTPFEPINIILKRTMKYGYCHHIERLMYIGNLMFLLEIDPNDVYDWFMRNFLDSYEWVMIPNVYGMSQYASTQMVTRPYFSSSNYLIRMSNIKKSTKFPLISGYKWYEIWDILYYNFIRKNKRFLATNYATANSVKLYEKKSKSEKEKIQTIAEKILRSKDFYIDIVI